MLSEQARQWYDQLIQHQPAATLPPPPPSASSNKKRRKSSVSSSSAAHHALLMEALAPSPPPHHPDQPRYCICQLHADDDDDMIACDNEKVFLKEFVIMCIMASHPVDDSAKRNGSITVASG